MKSLWFVVIVLSVVSSIALAGENKNAFDTPVQVKKTSTPTLVTVAEGVVGTVGVLGVGASAEAEREFRFVRFELARKKIIRESQANILKIESSIQAAGGPNTLAGSFFSKNLAEEKRRLYMAKMELAGSQKSSGPFKVFAGVSVGLTLATLSDLGLKLYYGRQGKDVGNFAIDDFAGDLASVVTDRTSQKQELSTRGLAEQVDASAAPEVSVK